MGVFDLTGRKALVTGGARGSGPGWPRHWPAAGAAVMIGDLLEDQGRRTAEEHHRLRCDRRVSSRSM